MRTPKRHRRVRAAPVERLTFGGGLTVAVYADHPNRPKTRLGIGDAARKWRKAIALGRRVVASCNGFKVESGRCPRCGRVTNGSGNILGGQDAGEREHSYCPACLPIVEKAEREGAAIKHELHGRQTQRVRAVAGAQRT